MEEELQPEKQPCLSNYMFTRSRPRKCYFLTPHIFQAKLNLGLLGLVLIVVSLVVSNLDFDSLEETYALASASS